MPDFRRGAAAIAESQKKAKANSGGRTFTPTIWWTDPDKDKSNSTRYLLFLNPLEAIPNVEFIGMIPQKGKKQGGDTFTYYESVIARTDPAIDESVDPMTRDWDAQPRDTNIAVAVELEPVLEERQGRKRPVGFEVAMTEFDRRIRDDNGDLTDETETVEAPVVGFVQQSPHNFFNLVVSYDNDTGPIESTPLKITRVDTKTYSVEGFLDMPVDLSGLVDYIDNLSYLNEDDTDALLDQIDQLELDQAAEVIGEVLLDKRLEELSDEDRYNKIFESITESLDVWGNKNGNKKGGKEKSKRERPARRSSRRSAQEISGDEAHSPGQDSSEAEIEAEEKVEEKPARKRRAPKAKTEEAPEAPGDDTPEKSEPVDTDRAAAAKAKLDAMRARAGKRNSA